MTWLQADADHLSQLFDVAGRATDEQIAQLSLGDQEEVAAIRQLLGIIDAAWYGPEALLDRVDALFLRKLAAEEPEHPWVQGSIVRTLGELIQATDDARTVLSEPIYTQLIQDPTPIETLMDPAVRSRVVGQAVKRVAMPQDRISDFVLWLHRLIANLVSPATSSRPGLIFTRRQGKRRRGPNHGQ